MPTPAQIAKRKRIEEAAYAILRDTGYKGTSLLSVALRARVSNETLYKWYGNKQGLFRALILSNVDAAKSFLEDALSNGGDPLEKIGLLGPLLLSLVTSEKAIALNRAAAADASDTNTLGPAVRELGRETIAPLLTNLIEAAAAQGFLRCDDAATAAEIYFRLLIGDLQIRRVIGVEREPSPLEIERRAAQAMTLFRQLYAADHTSRANPL